MLKDLIVNLIKSIDSERIVLYIVIAFSDFLIKCLYYLIRVYACIKSKRQFIS